MCFNVQKEIQKHFVYILNIYMKCVLNLKRSLFKYKYTLYSRNREKEKRVCESSSRKYPSYNVPNPRQKIYLYREYVVLFETAVKCLSLYGIMVDDYNDG